MCLCVRTIKECTAMCGAMLCFVRIFIAVQTEVFRSLESLSENLLIKQLLKVAAVSHGRRASVLFGVLVFLSCL